MNVRLLACLWGASLVSAAPSFGIPQNFSTGGVFAQAAGARFEEFAAARETWSSGALKGDWSEPKGGEQTLKNDAVVFGVPAAAITAERTSEGLQRFRVLFRGEAGKAGQSQLFDRVTRNVRAFTGHAGRTEGRDRQTFRHSGGVQIVVRNKSASEVEVEFRPGS